MGSERGMVLRRAVVPFLAGAAAAAALLNGFYATATVALLVALWAAVLIGQAAAFAAAPPPAPPSAPPVDEEEQRRLRLYLDLSPAPLVAIDADERLRAVNRAARRLFAVDDLVAAPPPAVVEAIRATPPGSSSTLRIAAVGAGEHAFAMVTADLDRGGAHVRVAALIDIDADLRAAEAATLHDLVAVLGHEVTNTLTPIASLSASAAALLNEAAPDLAEARAAIEIVSRRALAFQRFGEAYRDLARLPPPQRRRFDLAASVQDLARLFRTRWPETVLEVIAPPRLEVSGDPDQVAQALWALLDNAAAVARHVRIGLARSGLGASITIADDGPGIAAADLDGIFRPFFTTKPAGSGVGLALARQIFRAHGGDLTLAQAAPSAIFVAVW